MSLVVYVFVGTMIVAAFSGLFFAVKKLGDLCLVRVNRDRPDHRKVNWTDLFSCICGTAFFGLFGVCALGLFAMIGRAAISYFTT